MVCYCRICTFLVLGKEMKVSIIISVLNSHLVVKRQIRHFRRLRLPDDVEIIFMDDGSDPPLEFGDMGLRNFTIHKTHDKRLWTQGLARNKAAELAKGEFLFMTDIDHIITGPAIRAARSFDGDRMVFHRWFGILSARGAIITDLPSLYKFGLSRNRVASRRGLSGGYHGNTFCIRKTAFFELGMYSLIRANLQLHTMGEDREFRKRWDRGVERGSYKGDVAGPSIYFYPTGRFQELGENNPRGLFHDSHRNDLDK